VNRTLLNVKVPSDETLVINVMINRDGIFLQREGSIAPPLKLPTEVAMYFKIDTEGVVTLQWSDVSGDVTVVRCESWAVKVNDAVGRQNVEFDALIELTERWRRLQMTPVVDDDYPGARRVYEVALERFREALKVNRPEWFSAPAPGVVTDFVHVSQMNLSRCLRWHPEGLQSWSLSDWYTALSGEVGELGNVIKKLNRNRDGLPGNKETPAELWAMLPKECADVVLYLDLLAQRVGFDLMIAVRDKFNETSQRLGFPERL